MSAGATMGWIPTGPPLPPLSWQMQAEEEDNDFKAVLQLQRKERLQHLLAMLSSALVLSPQMAACPCRESRPHGPPEER